jgi:7,8-dihydropterin-6-yl-methyl-4-(beta-D-ribofuranosyl)aminobenzene 5'-phosphate synthase
MNQEMTRREFLEVAMGTSVFVTVGGLWTGDLAAEGAVTLPESERIVVTVVTDNLADATRPNVKIARRPAGGKTAVDAAMHAEHGLAYHVETTVDGKPHAFLFDFGTQAQGVKRNIDFLNLDFRKVEAMAISHDHWDHEAAFIELMQAKRDEFTQAIPLYVGQGFFAGTYARRPTGQIQTLSVLSRDDVEKLGMARIVEVTVPTRIVPGAFLTGVIERFTDYEKVSATFIARKGDEYVQEDFRGEQAVVMNARGKGLVVLTACAHRGVVNTVRHAQKMTGIDKVHAIIGGFHLTGASPELIEKTIADVKALRPDHVVPTHCTGFEAMTAFARAMPEQFILNTAGTRYFIEA